MRLLFIRHGDPDYENDSLTAEGFKEAKALVDYYGSQKIDYMYVSPLGRAQDTARPLATVLGITPVTKDWLKEFHIPVNGTSPDYPDAFNTNEHPGHIHSPWDIYPQYMQDNPSLYDIDSWKKHHLFDNAEVISTHDETIRQFDLILESHGYKRNGTGYDVTSSNHDTLAFVSHFGLSTILISHLLNCSPYVLWQGSCATPSSVTEIYTEERKPGFASFRMIRFADVSHLALKGLKDTFSGRFCECYEDDDRH